MATHLYGAIGGPARTESLLGLRSSRGQRTSIYFARNATFRLGCRELREYGQETPNALGAQPAGRLVRAARHDAPHPSEGEDPMKESTLSKTASVAVAKVALVRLRANIITI